MKFSIEKKIITTKFDNELVILNIITGKYYTLKGSGIRIWELLQEHNEVDEIFQILKEEYKVDPIILSQDFNKLISNFMDAKLVISL
jgi:hypothetical protein